MSSHKAGQWARVEFRTTRATGAARLIYNLTGVIGQYFAVAKVRSLSVASFLHSDNLGKPAWIPPCHGKISVLPCSASQGVDRSEEAVALSALSAVTGEKHLSKHFDQKQSQPSRCRFP
ncbi:hypothetical protein J6590_053017 [Homalodisca vitripennis]|nr:hypothetical protein J6590_053017 [Homalodisca vitripennis]